MDRLENSERNQFLFNMSLNDGANLSVVIGFEGARPCRDAPGDRPSHSLASSVKLNLAPICWSLDNSIMHPLSDEYDESKDQSLVSEARAGSGEAIEALARAHQRFIYNIALRMVRDPHDAADLTQEILLKMLANLSKFENKSSFRSWLYRMAVNHLISATRRKSETEVHSFEH